MRESLLEGEQSNQDVLSLPDKHTEMQRKMNHSHEFPQEMNQVPGSSHSINQHHNRQVKKIL